MLKVLIADDEPYVREGIKNRKLDFMFVVKVVMEMTHIIKYVS